MNRVFWAFLLLKSTLYGQYSTLEKDSDSIATQNLEEVVISATRTERQLSSLPLPVTLISKDQIRNTGRIRLDEILQEQTGIITVADESGFEGVQMQGIGSEYIMILIDGVPLIGRSSGNFDISRLTVGNIKQIEVVKGPSSSLYGSEALGGVINIITEKPKKEKISGNTSYRLGSYTQQDVNLSLKQKIKGFGYTLFANRFSSEGYDLNPNIEGQTVDPFENYTVNGQLHYDFSDKLSVFSSSRFYYQAIDSELFSDGLKYKSNDEEIDWNTHLRFNHKWNENLHTEYEFYFTNYNTSQKLVNEPTGNVLSESDFDQGLARLEIRTNYKFKNGGQLTSGAGYQYEYVDRTSFDQEVDFSSQYIYIQYDTNLIQNLNAIGGVRFDNHSEYSNQLSPKLALRYEVTDNLAAKASFGYGFKAPDFRQLYLDFTNSAVGYTVLGYNVAVEKLNELVQQGQILDVVISEDELQNPLEAENSIGYNVGLTYKSKKWNTEINFFRNDFKNLIDTRIIARKNNGQNVFSYQNFDEVFTTGLELNIQYKPINRFQINAGYQLLYTYDKQKLDMIDQGQIFAREPQTNTTIAIERSDYLGLVNRSRHNANIKFFYDIKSANTNINLRLLYRSKYGLFDTNGNGIIDDYDLPDSFVNAFVTANIAATKNFCKNFDLQIGANNLFDFTDGNIPTQPGIQLFARLNYKF